MKKKPGKKPQRTPKKKKKYLPYKEPCKFAENEELEETFEKKKIENK